MAAPRDPVPTEELEARLAAARAPGERVRVALDLAWGLRTADPKRGGALAREALDALDAQAGADAPLHEAELARAHMVLGVCLRNASELAEAARHAQEAVRRKEALGAAVDAHRLSVARTHYGITLTMLGRLEDALAQFESARDASRAAGDELGAADALMDIAVVSNMMGEDARAVALYREVLPFYAGIGDDYHRATALNNMAYAHVCQGAREREAGRADEAAALFAQAVDDAGAALPLAERAGHPDFVVSCLDTLSSAYREQGDWPRARDTLERQLALARGLDGRRMEAVTLGNIGEVQRRLGEPAAAIATLERADALFGTMGLSEQHAQTLASLADACEAHGRYADALAAHRRFHALEARVKSQAAEEKMRALESRLQLARAEAELALAREREAELAALNARLVATDRERAALFAELERQSQEDALTGLANRRTLDRRLEHEFLRARRDGSPLAVALLDLDFFKQINDHHSHAVGDAVLAQSARLFEAALRATDLVARYGGEEFALVLPNTALAEGVQLCEKLRARVEAHPWASPAGPLAVTVSIGVAALEPGHHAPDRLLTDADHWLYAAKRQGRNRVCADTGVRGRLNEGATL